MRDDGYDYAGEGDPALIIYLRSDAPERDVDAVIATLRENEVCGNRILDTAVIGVSQDGRSFQVVHPPGHLLRIHAIDS